MRRQLSPATVLVRRELAQLLWRLRAIRRQSQSHDHAIRRINIALIEAGHVSRFVKFDATKADGASACDWRARVDRRRLAESGYAAHAEEERGAA